jgi:F0F1-type ATP synthase assembly protein I
VSKVNNYQEQSNSFLIEKLKQARSQRDSYKEKYETEKIAKFFWKLIAVIMAGVIIGQLFGGNV